MRAHVLTIGGTLLAVTLASGCVRTKPGRAASARPSAASIVAGDCPAGSGPMQPAAGAREDRNGDGYLCRKAVVSIAGDTLFLYVDNDVRHAGDASEAAPALSAMYGGM